MEINITMNDPYSRFFIYQVENSDFCFFGFLKAGRKMSSEEKYVAGNILTTVCRTWREVYDTYELMNDNDFKNETLWVTQIYAFAFLNDVLYV